MPELPEVETVRRTLAATCGLRIETIVVSGQALRQRPLKAEAFAPLLGTHIQRIDRRGKYLLLRTDGTHGAIVHLGMSGRWIVCSADTAPISHTHVVIDCPRKDMPALQLRFIDPRRFGQFEPVPCDALDTHPSIRSLGPDPLVDEVLKNPLWTELQRRFSSRRQPIKLALLDQRLIAGVGNIYAAEALWRARVHPEAPAHQLEPATLRRVVAAVRASFVAALTRGGTSLRDFVNAYGQQGTNAHYLRVYGRAGERCTRCRAIIEVEVMAGRSTFLCPGCQSRQPSRPARATRSPRTLR